MAVTRVTISDCSLTAWEHVIDYHIVENFMRHKVLQFLHVNADSINTVP